MQQIDIDFDVFKALTLRRTSEAHSYNEVLREVLGLNGAEDSSGQAGAANPNAIAGRAFGGRFLPNGTRLRATYKQRPYEASIIEGELIDQSGRQHSSASAAARAITNTNVNGLTFWQVRRPTDGIWRKLVALPKAPE